MLCLCFCCCCCSYSDWRNLPNRRLLLSHSNWHKFHSVVVCCVEVRFSSWFYCVVSLSVFSYKIHSISDMQCIYSLTHISDVAQHVLARYFFLPENPKWIIFFPFATAKSFGMVCFFVRSVSSSSPLWSIPLCEHLAVRSQFAICSSSVKRPRVTLTFFHPFCARWHDAVPRALRQNSFPYHNSFTSCWKLPEQQRLK